MNETNQPLAYVPIADLQRPTKLYGRFFSCSHGIMHDYYEILANQLAHDPRNRRDFPNRRERKAWAARQANSDLVWLLQSHNLLFRRGQERDEIVTPRDALADAPERLDRFARALNRKLEPSGYCFDYELHTNDELLAHSLE